MSITLSIASMPVKPAVVHALVAAQQRALQRRCRMPLISDDLRRYAGHRDDHAQREPLHVDVLQIVLARASLTVMKPVGFRRSRGISMRSTPDRKRPVGDAGFALSAAGVPSATTRPPPRPAPGPKSAT